MRLSRDTWLAIGLLVVLLAVTILAVFQQSRGNQSIPYDSNSTAPNGALALRLWLDDLGYTIYEERLSRFEIPPEVNLIFILEPLFPIETTEWVTLDRWVSNGGTLVLAGEEVLTIGPAMRQFQFTVRYVVPQTNTLTAQAPLLTSPPVGAAQVEARAYLNTPRDDFVTHLALPEGPVLVSFEQGQGRVMLSTAPFPFSNRGLAEPGNAELVLNLISAAPQINTIWFDEWHHGLRSEEVIYAGPADWLRYTPAGRAFVYVAVIVLVALLLVGQRFGRPVPLSRDMYRRTPLEYITAIANLGRRAGHRTDVLRQYHQRLKRGLGRRYRLNPTLPDDDYVEALSKLNPNLDVEALTRLLKRLKRQTVTEPDMIQLAAEVARWLKET